MPQLDPPAVNSYGIEVNSIVTPGKPRAKTTPLLGPANTNLIAPTAVTEIFQAGAKGGRVHLVETLATATQALTQLQLYRSAADGVAKRLIKTESFAQVTVNTTGKINSIPFDFNELKYLTLEPMEKLWMGSGITVTGINANVEGADW